MMAKFMATEIILGKPYASFETVPKMLKEQVATILKDNGLEELITDEDYK